MKSTIGIFIVIFVTAMTQAQLAQNDVPAFHDKPPAKGEVLPAVLTEKQLAEQGLTAPAQIEAYRAAAKAPGVMHQMPCYCFCDRNHGHKSLHSCFEGTHGANCGVCIGEALYAYQMSRKGWTAKMIRDGIMRGDFKTMDLQHPEHVM
ncbi:MAG TPA: CYCXC family (seleno)protein [Candidatus Angelobacter sp.]|nr:CYCXC family (seleno)protein [Candidatus Angelobacter sp.]